MKDIKTLHLCGYLIAVLLFIIDVTYGYCSTASTCNGECTLDSTSTCVCGLSIKQDVIFIVDGTTALSKSDFDQVKRFLNQTVKYALPESSSLTRVGLYQYTATTSYVTHQALASSTTRAQTLSVINQMTSQQADSASANPDAAVGGAITTLSSSASDRRRVLILIAAEPSSVEVCSKAPRDSDIFAYVITIGTSWTTKMYHCLTSNRDKGKSLIELRNASSIATTGTLNKMEDFLCPTTPLVKITEVKPIARGTARYVELKNYGPTIPLSTTGLKLAGFWSNTFTTTTSTSWTQGQYLVVYQVSDGLPDCSGCGCSLTSGTNLCSTALYVGCCPNATASCTVNSPAKKSTSCGTFVNTVTQTTWTLTLSVGSSSSVDVVTYSSTDTTKSWPIPNSAFTGSSYELVYPMWVTAWGSSWTLSCNLKGTPGYTHSTCTCTNSTSCAMSGGGSASTCSSGVCSCASGYFSNELTCDKFPALSTCTARKRASPSVNFVDFIWSLPNWERFHKYRVKYCATGSTSCESTTTGFGVTSPQGGVNTGISNPGSVALLASTVENTGAFVTCPLTTIAPTTQPTKAPTFQRPNITICNYTINQARTQYVVKWSYPIGGDIVALGEPTEYRIYENNDVSAKKSVSGTQTAVIDGGNFNIFTTKISVEAYWSGTPSYTTYRKICTNFTQAPTRTPTKKPTRRPTTSPTKRPTSRPTASPTYRKLSTSNCVIAYPSGTSKTASITYTQPSYDPPQTVTASDTRFELSPSCDSTITDSWPATLTQPIKRTLNAVYSHACLRPKWVEHGTTDVYGDFVTCVITTVSPTAAPTRSPTYTPTDTPTHPPTAAPTRSPTRPPTHSPTFRPVNITLCNFQLDSGNAYGTAYFNTIKVEYPETPNASNIAYTFIFNINNQIQTYPLLNPLLQSSLRCDDGRKVNDTPCLAEHHLVSELSPPFNYSRDSVQMVAKFTDIYDSNGGSQASIQCNVKTAAPTASPTRHPTNAPTSAPTAGPTQVYFTVPMCDDSVPKKDDTTWGNPPDSSTRNSERCGCDTWEADCDDPSKPMIPIIVVTESDKPDQVPVPVKRSEPSYVYDLNITFTVGFVNRSFAAGTEFNDTLKLYNQLFFKNNENQSVYVSIPDDSWFTPEHLDATVDGAMGPTKDDIKNWHGAFILKGGDSRSGNVLLDAFREFPKDGRLEYSTDLENEVFFLKLTGCSVINNQSRAGAQSNDIRICTLVYPTSVFLIVQDADERNSENTLTTKNTSYESWLWYVLGGIGIFLAVAGFMAYRWWVNNKMKQAEVKQADEDIDAVIHEQEEGFGNDLDQVAVNPLAQPFTHLQGPTNKDFNTDDTEAEDGMTEKAEVRTEKIKFKQEFGPSQATKKN